MCLPLVKHGWTTTSGWAWCMRIDLCHFTPEGLMPGMFGRKSATTAKEEAGTNAFKLRAPQPLSASMLALAS